jgi:hypothetical protein
VSDLDLILKILKEEVQVDGGSPTPTQTHVDGIPVSQILSVKRELKPDPNSRGGLRKMTTTREISEPYRRKYKLNNSTGEIVPYTPEEQRNRRDGAVNPDQNSDYAKYQKNVLGQNGPIGSHNKQAMKSRQSLENRHSRTERDVAKVNDFLKKRQQINNAKSNFT